MEIISLHSTLVSSLFQHWVPFLGLLSPDTQKCFLLKSRSPFHSSWVATHQQTSPGRLSAENLSTRATSNLGKAEAFSTAWKRQNCVLFTSMWNWEDRKQIYRSIFLSRQLDLKCLGVNMSRTERMSFTADNITADMHTVVVKVFVHVGMCDAV